MTLEEFLAALAQTPRDWRLIRGEIRRRLDRWSRQCPLQALGVEDMPDPQYYSIALAADNEEGHDPALRRKLLEACGLEGVGG